MLSQVESHELDEQGVPSYLHQNPLASTIFWRRIRVVMNYLAGMKIGTALDYGCGSGILFPFLAEKAEELCAFDLEPEPASKLVKSLNLQNIRILDDLNTINSLKTGSFDTILALDVLEHVDDLGATCELMSRLIKPQGRMVISGPTESMLYRLGRRVAGYKEHFHLQNIYQVEWELSKYFEIKLLETIFPVLNLFRVSVATLK